MADKRLVCCSLHRVLDCTDHVGREQPRAIGKWEAELLRGVEVQPIPSGHFDAPQVYGLYKLVAAFNVEYVL